MVPERTPQEVFGERAAMYTTSDVHRDPDVLARLVRMADADPNRRVLDIGTGTGHTALALAPHVREVIAVDLTPEMLAEAEALRAARNVGNVRFELADAHALPFPDVAFDVVVCRRAAHHFTDIHLAVSEMRRVLAPDGRLVIDDRSVPEDDEADACMNQLDVYHDRSHVRQYRPSEWQAMLTDAGFTVRDVAPYHLHRPVGSLTDRVATEDVALIHQTLSGLSQRLRALMNVTDIDGVLHLNHWYVMIAADAA